MNDFGLLQREELYRDLEEIVRLAWDTGYKAGKMHEDIHGSYIRGVAMARLLRLREFLFDMGLHKAPVTEVQGMHNYVVKRYRPAESLPDLPIVAAGKKEALYQAAMQTHAPVLMKVRVDWRPTLKKWAVESLKTVRDWI